MYVVEFADAERKLREKQIGEEAKNWQAVLRVMGDVAIVVEGTACISFHTTMLFGRPRSS